MSTEKNEKPIGRVKRLSALINISHSLGDFQTVQEKMQEKNYLLTNGYQAPIPQRMLNQRQIRKRKRQSQKHK